MVGWYQQTYDLLNGWIYGGLAAEGSYPDMVCCLLATIFCVGAILLPFVAVFSAIKRLFSWWS